MKYKDSYKARYFGYPFRLEGLYKVRIRVGEFKSMEQTIDHGDPPDKRIVIDGQPMPYNNNTCVNVTKLSDDRIHSFHHFLERIDAAFQKIWKTFADNGIMIECPSSEKMFMLDVKLGTIKGSTEITGPGQDHVYVYINDWTAEQLGYDKSKLIKHDGGWYMIRNIEYPKLHPDYKLFITGD